MTEFNIKISGGGTKNDILEALDALKISLLEWGFTNASSEGKATLEDETLCTEISIDEG